MEGETRRRPYLRSGGSKPVKAHSGNSLLDRSLRVSWPQLLGWCWFIRRKERPTIYGSDRHAPQDPTPAAPSAK